MDLINNMKLLNKFFVLVFCCSLVARGAPGVPISEVFAEKNLWKLRLQLPEKLHVSGANIKLPSGRLINQSILATLARQEYEKNRWTLSELFESLGSPDDHVRCMSLILLVDVTGISEDNPSFLMSLAELKSSGVIAKWKKIVEDTLKQQGDAKKSKVEN